MTTPNLGTLVPAVPTSGHGSLETLTPEQLEQTATFLATEYQEATAAIRTSMLAIAEQCRRLREAFSRPDDRTTCYFDMGFCAVGDRHASDDERIFTHMKRHAWERIVDTLGVKNIMSVKQREQFEQQLREDKLPDITAEAILGLVGTLASQVQSFARDACREVFDILRPGHSAYIEKFKTNDPFRVGRKVILSYYVERGYSQGAFHINYHHEKHIRAIDAVFHLLDGAGVILDHKSPLIKAIEESPDGKGKTRYFAFKCFKKRTLHLTFLDEELVKRLNLEATGDYVLGQDMKEED